MKTQKIANLLGNTDNESLKFATRKQYLINGQNNTDYGDGDENGKTIKFETKVIKSNPCDYSDTHILVTRDITVKNGSENTKVAFKNCAPFTKCVTHIKDEHVDNAVNLGIVMPMYNLIEYGDNYSDTSGSLWEFKKNEKGMNNRNPIDTNADNSSSNCFRALTAADNRVFKNGKIAVPLKYSSNFWRSLVMPLINC